LWIGREMDRNVGESQSPLRLYFEYSNSANSFRVDLVTYYTWAPHRAGMSPWPPPSSSATSRYPAATSSAPGTPSSCTAMPADTATHPPSASQPSDPARTRDFPTIRQLCAGAALSLAKTWGRREISVTSWLNFPRIEGTFPEVLADDHHLGLPSAGGRWRGRPYCRCHTRRVIGSRWVSQPLAFAGQMQPRRLNN
jgi:hypothetical protein